MVRSGQTGGPKGAGRPTVAHMLPWPSIGGVEVATFRLIEATREEFRHVAFCMPGTAALQAACAGAGAEVTTYVPPEPSLRHFPRFLGESRLVARELTRQRTDLVHCSETKAAYHNSLAVLLAGLPLMSHVRSRYSKIGVRDRLSFLPIHRFVFVSKDSRRQFGLKVSDRKARVLYDGIDFPETGLQLGSQADGDAAAIRAQLGVPAGAPLIGMVARVNPQKDYDTLADAAALVLAQCPQARFAVIGDNSVVELNRRHYGHVRSRLQALGIEDRFVFTGFRADVPEIVAALDVFVLCTHREGLPLSVLEAMAQGKPVIATAVDGIPELIVHGEVGLLHAHGDSAELAELILRCIRDPEMACKMGLAARAHCRLHFNQATFASNAATLYREMLPA